MTVLDTSESYINVQFFLKASEVFDSATSFGDEFTSVISWHGKAFPYFHSPVSLKGPFVLILGYRKNGSSQVYTFLILVIIL